MLFLSGPCSFCVRPQPSGERGAEGCRGQVCVRGGPSTLELVKATIAHSDGLLGGGRQGVAGRAFCAEDVAAVSTVVLGE